MELDCKPIYRDIEMDSDKIDVSKIHVAFEFWRQKDLSQVKSSWRFQRRANSISFPTKHIELKMEKIAIKERNLLKTRSVYNIESSDINSVVNPTPVDVVVSTTLSNTVLTTNENGEELMDDQTKLSDTNCVDEIPPLDISKIHDFTSQHSHVNQKRQSFASQKKDCISPTSPSNPISVVRENVLGKSDSNRSKESTGITHEEKPSRTTSPRLCGRSQSCVVVAKEWSIVDKHKKMKSSNEDNSSDAIPSKRKSASCAYEKSKNHSSTSSTGSDIVAKNRSPRKSLTQSSPKSKDSSPRNQRVFAVSLESLPHLDFIPYFVIDACTNLLENKEFCDWDTLLQPAMTSNELSRIKLSIEDGSLNIKQENDLVIVINSLTLFFEELPESIFSQRNFVHFTNIMKIKNKQIQLQYAHSLLNALSLPKRKVLNYISNFLLNFIPSKSNLKKICHLWCSLIYKAPLFPQPSLLDVPRSNSDHRSKPVFLDQTKQISDSVLFEKQYRKAKSLSIDDSSKVLLYILKNYEFLFSLNLPDRSFTLTEDHKIQVESCTKDLLFDMMINEYYDENEFKDTLFATYPVLMTSEDFFEGFINVFKLSERKKDWILKRRRRILKLLVYWFKHFPNTSLGSQEFIDVAINKRHKSISAEEDLLWAEVYKTLMGQLSTAGEELVLPTSFERKISLEKIMNYDPMDIAKAITMLDFYHFKKIDVQEYLTHPISADKTPNLFKMTTQFNKLSLWVQTMIISGQNVEERVSIISFLSKLLNELIQLRNYHSALSIYTGLEASVLSSYLVKTIAKSKKKIHKTMDYCSNLFSMHKNYKTYFECLRKHKEMDSIPIIVLISKNLASVDEVQELYIGNRVNFEKLRSIYAVLKDTMQCLQSKFKFEIPGSLICYFDRLDVKTEVEIEDTCKLLDEKCHLKHK